MNNINNINNSELQTSIWMKLRIELDIIIDTNITFDPWLDMFITLRDDTLLDNIKNIIWEKHDN